eukprot:SM002177S06659  [mRNA]  locus=s2177:475:1425:- [translate_table: standard]
MLPLRCRPPSISCLTAHERPWRGEPALRTLTMTATPMLMPRRRAGTSPARQTATSSTSLPTRTMGLRGLRTSWQLRTWASRPRLWMRSLRGTSRGYSLSRKQCWNRQWPGGT